MPRFEPGTSIVKREVWGTRTWLRLPVRVVADDGDLLAVVLEDGAAFTFDDAEPPHPWSGRAGWRGATVLQLRRAGDWYSVWRFFDGERPTGWYVNFERPYLRSGAGTAAEAGIDTDDLELDLVVHEDGTRAWKDVEALHARLAEGRFGLDDLTHVLAAAADVVELLDHGRPWWLDWRDWRPRDA